ncbi:hypothetical protein CsSME_00029152 [Camellia sinensis var. sinensis]
MAKNLASFIENTNTTMVEIAHRIGYSHDLSQQRRLEDAGYAVGARVLELLFHQENVNPHSHQLKLCDFGSAKMLVPGEPNIFAHSIIGLQN